MAAAAMQGPAHQEQFWGLTCRPGELDQRPSDNQTLAQPLSHSHPTSYIVPLQVTYQCHTLSLPQLNDVKNDIAVYFDLLCLFRSLKQDRDLYCRSWWNNIVCPALAQCVFNAACDLQSVLCVLRGMCKEALLESDNTSWSKGSLLVGGRCAPTSLPLFTVHFLPACALLFNATPQFYSFLMQHH